MRVRITIQVNGRPLPHTFVEHIVAGIGTGMYLTDAQGRVRDNNFDQGIDSFTPNADIRVLCQNAVIRVLDGGAFNIGVYQDKSGLTDGATVNLNVNSEQQDHYEVLDRAWRAYHLVFRPLSFFQSLNDPDFPLGRSSGLRATKDRAARIDLSYPDGSVAPRAWVEPRRLGDGFPLMHIKLRSTDGRLFGEADDSSDDIDNPTLIPGELAHALHFGHLGTQQRGRAQDKYAEFIASELFAGRAGTHAFSQRTSAEVAYIEAADHFAGRFSEFIRAKQGTGPGTPIAVQAVTPELQREFVDGEWLRVTNSRILNLRFPGLPAAPRVPVAGAGRVELLTRPTARLTRRPRLTGGDVEGAIYSAIFVDFAREVGLDLAASSYFAANAITFGQYRAFLNDAHPEHAATLETVRQFWGI